jgi:hypothetical protein
MSEIKVNKISPRTACGTTTLGDSGDTFTIPAGVSITNSGTASGFGATGAASWNTTVKTGDFTAVAGEGYFVNTTSGAVNATLPAGTAGAVVAIKDYAGTFDTNAVTLVRNGSDKIGGQAVNATLSTEGTAVTLVFIDSTQGWLVTDSGLQTEAPTTAYVTATGGTITTCGDFKIHTFTGPGALCVSDAGNAQGNNEIEYIVVAGAGGAGYDTGGGGGAGGFRFASPSLAPATYPGKPLAAPAGLTASVASFPIVVGGGGTSQASGGVGAGSSGSNSSFSTITSAGGGGGGSGGGSPGIRTGLDGGSGGGGGNPNGSGGDGDTPSVSPAQGFDGGDNQIDNVASGGGGGATQRGQDTQPSDTGGYGGNGAGIPTAFGSNGVPCGSFRYYAGGGGGGGRSPSHGPAGAGGKGGGGAGVQTGAGNAGTVNTGGGAGGPSGTSLAQAGAGGSGIVIIRYKFQN